MSSARGASPIRQLATAASLLALASCASVGPEAALAPVAVPSDWAAVSGELSGTAPVTPDWLGELTDPAVTGLVAEAIAYNNQLAAAGARVRAAREQARIARSGLLPQISADLTGVRSRSSGLGGFVGGVPQPGGVYANSFSSGLNLAWELDLWGRLTDQTRAAYLQRDAQALDYAAAALSIAGGAAQSYYALTEAQLQTQLAERDVETGETNLRIIERRFDRGISTSLDVRLARSSLAQSRAQLIGRRQAAQEAARRLEVILGRYPGAEVAAAETLPRLEALAGAVTLGEPAALLLRRPDILSAEARLRAANLDVSAARKALLPSLSLRAGLSGDTFAATGAAGEGRPGLDFDALTDPEQLGKRLIGSLVQPIFQGGRLRAQVAARRAQMEAAVYDYAQTALTAYNEVEDALAAEAFLSAQLDARTLAFEEARAAEELTERRYLQGAESIFNLINAQQRRIGAESQFIAAQRARITNRIDLYLALGAPFEAPAYLRPGSERFTDPARDPAASPAAADAAPRRGLFGFGSRRARTSP